MSVGELIDYQLKEEDKYGFFFAIKLVVEG
jgi:hypothetical protein